MSYHQNNLRTSRNTIFTYTALVCIINLLRLKKVSEERIQYLLLNKNRGGNSYKKKSNQDKNTQKKEADCLVLKHENKALFQGNSQRVF